MMLNSLYLVGDEIKKCVDAIGPTDNQFLHFQDETYMYECDCTLLEKYDDQVYFSQRAKIVRWYFANTGMSRTQLAEKYGVSYSTIASLVKKIYKPGEKRGPKSNWRR